MKQYRFYTVMMLVLMLLTSGLVLAQDSAVEPTVAKLAPDMEFALVPCGDDVTGPCDLIATSVEDVVGVWAQYMIFPGNSNPGSLIYIRYNADGTFVAADSIEHTVQPTEPYPSGTYRFEDGYLIFDAIPTIPAPCNEAGVFQARVLKYGDEPVALRYVPISDACTPRLQDLIQAAVWVAE